MAARRQRQLSGIGTPAPGFRLARLEGGEVTLAELSAEARVLLVFFKISCPVCQLTAPFLERLHASGGLAVYGKARRPCPRCRATIVSRRDDSARTTYWCPGCQPEP